MVDIIKATVNSIINWFAPGGGGGSSTSIPDTNLAGNLSNVPEAISRNSSEGSCQGTAGSLTPRWSARQLSSRIQPITPPLTRNVTPVPSGTDNFNITNDWND